MIEDFTDLGNFAKFGKAAAEHATDFNPPIYNIWKQRAKTANSQPRTGPAGFSGAVKPKVPRSRCAPP